MNFEYSIGVNVSVAPWNHFLRLLVKTMISFYCSQWSFTISLSLSFSSLSLSLSLFLFSFSFSLSFLFSLPLFSLSPVPSLLSLSSIFYPLSLSLSLFLFHFSRFRFLSPLSTNEPMHASSASPRNLPSNPIFLFHLVHIHFHPRARMPSTSCCPAPFSPTATWWSRLAGGGEPPTKENGSLDPGTGSRYAHIGRGGF